jgi:transposase-like protein
MPRTIKRYSEAYKQKVIQDIDKGKYDSISGAARANGIDKYETVTRWLRQGGRSDLLPKVVIVEVGGSSITKQDSINAGPTQ